MFPNGLSIIVHAFILLLALVKRLVEYVAEKMRWDIFKFKMNLYLRLKIGAPLVGASGDTLPRKIFSVFIILAVFVSVIVTMYVNIGSRLTENSNIDFILGLFGSKPLFAQSTNDSLYASDYAAPNHIAHLPSDFYDPLPGNDRFSQGFVSLNFDDGWLVTYQNALPILNKAGLKSTQNIITGEFKYSSLYVSRAQVLVMQADGHEIGDHTKSHLHLNQLTDAQEKREITSSKNDLLLTGVKNLSTFDYAHGEYNDFIMTVLKESDFAGARTVNLGFNTKSTEPFLLKAQVVDANTTLEQVKGWIDQAVRDKTWVILVFHQIDHSGRTYSSTPETLQQIVDYLVQKNVPVRTNAEGISLLGN